MRAVLYLLFIDGFAQENATAGENVIYESSTAMLSNACEGVCA